jgi:hypothetical protein
MAHVSAAEVHLQALHFLRSALSQMVLLRQVAVVVINVDDVLENELPGDGPVRLKNAA